MKIASDRKRWLEHHIRSGLRKHLRDLGFRTERSGRVAPRHATKDEYRDLHRGQRRERLAKEQAFINQHWPALGHCFADGMEVNPSKILPRLEVVDSDTWQADLFRLATMTWSIPVSRGFGRRIRLLVWDDYNKKLIGVIALGDPVFNLSVRDQHIGWSTRYRQSRLVNVMDAYVLGALPPYNLLLGGKLVACLVRTKEVRDIFRRKYSASRGLISRRKKSPRLVAVTTTSALGKSAVFDRLKLGETRYFESIGFTRGWGHFHISKDLFAQIREYLALVDDKYANGYRFGEGPNWKLRAVRKALKLVGMNEDVLNHGIPREVYICRLASNAEAVLSKRDLRRPVYPDLLTVREVGNQAVNRWVLRRAQSRPEYLSWNRENLADLIGVQKKARAPSGQTEDFQSARARELYSLTETIDTPPSGTFAQSSAV